MLSVQPSRQRNGFKLIVVNDVAYMYYISIKLDALIVYGLDDGRHVIPLTLSVNEREVAELIKQHVGGPDA